jgi:hypothetical protein
VGQESGDDPGPSSPPSPKTGLLLPEPELELRPEGLLDCLRVDADTGVDVAFVTAAAWVSGAAALLLDVDVPGE